MEEDKTLKKALEEFIKVQTQLNEKELENIKKSINEIEVLNKKVEESYNNLMSLDKNELIDKIMSTFSDEHRMELWYHSKELKAYLFNEKDVDLDLLFSRLNYLKGDIFGEKRKMAINIDGFINEIERGVRGYKKEQEEEKIEEKSQTIFGVAKDEGLLSINKKIISRICLEKGIKILKRNIPLVVEIVKNKLLRSIINQNENKSNPLRISIPRDIKEKIFERDNNNCKVCGATDYLEVGHKIPISKGGENNPTNLITLCRKCNSKIGTNVIISN